MEEKKINKVLTETEMKKIIVRWLMKLDVFDMYNVAGGYDSFKYWADGKACECYLNYEELARIADQVVMELVVRRLDGKSQEKQAVMLFTQTELKQIACRI